jgi:triosephosphate isomerase (TIM)
MANAERGILIAGNWKMFKNRSETESFIQLLAENFPRHSGVSAMLCVGYTLLATATEATKRAGLPLKIAAQNMESREEGAYTGEVSPLQLRDLHVDAVVLGHSERRSYYNETDVTVNAKTGKALAHDLSPIVCVGETLEQREANQTDKVVTYQTMEALRGFSPEQVSKLVIAYEPVWAIGTGKVCEADEANRVCGVIREEIRQHVGDAVANRIVILYGGSMKPENAKELLSQPHIDGGLIGGASLTPDSFASLLNIACESLDSHASTVA